MNTKEQTKSLRWDTCQIAMDQANYLREVDPSLSEDAAFNEACGDSDMYQFEWEHLIDELTEWLDKMNPNSNWLVTINNFGWLNQSGYKRFHADNGKDFLNAVLPKTDNTFTIYNYGNHFEIINTHHDSPCGETYQVWPNEEEEC